MRSLLVSRDYFPPQTGGIARMMAEVVGRARGEICCLTAVTGNGRDRLPVYRSPAAFNATGLRRGLALAGVLAPILARERPRAVLLSTIGDGGIGLWLRRRLRLPLVTFAHGNEILLAARSGLDAPLQALRSADLVVAISRFSAGLAVEAGANPARVEIVCPGCDAERFRPQPRDPDLKASLTGDPDALVLLTVGNLVERKGHDLVIRALPALVRRFPTLTYVIAGDGPHRPALEALARELGVASNVRFVGRIDDERLLALYAVSDLFVMPSRDRREECDVEGFGLVFLEAGACERPVIGGRGGGIPDAVVDGETGRLVDPENVDEFVSAAAELLANETHRRRFGAAARRRILETFTWERFHDRFSSVLDHRLGAASHH